MKVSLVITVLNEDKTIDGFLASVGNQSLKPDEVIVVDGGSDDWTMEKLQKRNVGDLNLIVVLESGSNRSQGRNAGVKIAKNEIIAFTDAGCILDENWLEEIVKPFSDPKVEVIAGYYKGISKTVFEKCVIPYVLVMPDEVNENNFYPASRSMAIRKDTFWRMGGFPESISDNEDFVFANKLAKNGIKPTFVKKAIVSWIPRSNLKSFINMIFRFARGDAKAGLRYSKAITYFLRYFIFFLYVIVSFFKIFKKNYYLLFVPVILYFIWAILKNYRYIKDFKAFFWLPVLQVTSDFAVMFGTVEGLLSQNEKNPY